MRFAVGDVHGYRRELHAALRERALIDGTADWCGADAEVWFTGDLLDRGPAGIDVITDVMRWQAQAAETGGAVGSVLGNHEVLALGVRRFQDARLPDEQPGGPPHSFAASWLMNGGIARDQDLLTDEIADWLAGLPAAARTGGDLIVHSDTTDYLGWGDTAAGVTAAVSEVLHGDDLTAWWRLWRDMTSRHAFLGADGPERAHRLLAALGGERVVHGHTIIADLRDMDSDSVTEAWSYADGLALAVDGGIYDGGPCLVVPLE